MANEFAPNWAGQHTFSAGISLANQQIDNVADPTSAQDAATMAYADTKAPQTRTLTAGAGMAGGGDLSADRAFDVGAGDGISVAADSVAVDSTVARFNAPQLLSGAGAVNTTSNATLLTATGVGDALTLADHTVVGWSKKITGSSGYGANTSILTPSNFGDGTTITFSSNFDSVELQWDGVDWRLISKTGSVVIA